MVLGPLILHLPTMAMLSHSPAPRLFLLDRDGCINRDVGAPGVLTPEALHLLPGAAGAIRRIRAAGHRVAIVTNQSCRGKGLLSATQLDAVHERLRLLLAERAAGWDALFVCEDAQPSARKKPQPGMLLEAMAHFECSPGRCVMIGDSWTDMVAARRAGCPGALVTTGHGERVGAALSEYAIALPCTLDEATLRHAEDVLWHHREVSRCSIGAGGVATNVPEVREDALGAMLGILRNYPADTELIREAVPVRVYSSLQQAADEQLGAKLIV
ncbi:hypothetical protein AB1Y20_011795 [Prymnesium parvum]|uniref:D,D-heptose 1,7-bisphosphate phosphatase n=1 Tax=Prymnesium parvum TaxID=97485 RepID=A0AB34IJX7_PRYPA